MGDRPRRPGDQGRHRSGRRRRAPRGQHRRARHAAGDRRPARGAERGRRRARRAAVDRADAARRPRRHGRARRGGRRERGHPRRRDPCALGYRSRGTAPGDARGDGGEGPVIVSERTFDSPFDAISPLDYRFYGGDAKLYGELHPYLSEEAAIRYKARVEGALARAMSKSGLCSERVADAIEKACHEIVPAEVAQEETKTRHDVRALVNVIQSKVPDDAKRFVHLGATSYDIVDTANALRYRECVEKVVVPRLARAVAVCIKIAETEAETGQIGRTHGRHAEPITVGFQFAEYVARLGERTVKLGDAARALPGKLSGAVGAYSAMGLLTDDARTLEKRFLASLGLHPRSSSTQIVEPEGWTDLAHACITALGVMAKCADDLRHLQRSEIGEIAEAFGAEQVGSSTMPHKRNPVSFENVKSLWKRSEERRVGKERR